MIQIVLMGCSALTVTGRTSLTAHQRWAARRPHVGKYVPTSVSSLRLYDLCKIIYAGSGSRPTENAAQHARILKRKPTGEGSRYWPVHARDHLGTSRLDCRRLRPEVDPVWVEPGPAGDRRSHFE